MRKLTLLLSVVLTFSACSFDNTFSEDPDLTTIAGVLEEQKSDDDYSGTHILTAENKEVTPLRSLTFNLSGEQYLNNKVQVIGFLNTKDEVFEVSGISVLEVLSGEENISSQELYKNTDLGFEIRYYSDWTIEEVDNVVITAPELDRIEISQMVFHSDKVTDLTDSLGFLREYVKENYPGVSDFEKYLRKIGADNLDALKFEEKSGRVFYLFYRNGLVYEIAFVPDDKSLKSSDNFLIFEEMVNSFRFTGFTVDIEDSAEEDLGEPEVEDFDMELTTFESLPYKFRAKYPEDWYYAGNSGSGEVLHHYSFSDEAVTEENVLISLDVISSEIPSGKSVNLGKNKGISVALNDRVNIYLTVGGQNYRVTGFFEYEEIILAIAASISSLEESQ